MHFCYYHQCRELLDMTCQMANVLTIKCGVEKGDKVIVYMPTCPMAVAAMLACARIGAVHWFVTPSTLLDNMYIIVTEDTKLS